MLGQRCCRFSGSQHKIAFVGARGMKFLTELLDLCYEFKGCVRRHFLDLFIVKTPKVDGDLEVGILNKPKKKNMLSYVPVAHSTVSLLCKKKQAL